MKEMIVSINNPKIKKYSKLLNKKYRDEFNMFIVEGFNMVKEAQDANLIIEVLTSDKKYEGTLVAPFVLKKLTDAINPQPILAICQKPEINNLGKRILALDNVQDPGNVGTLIRSAKAFGFSDVIVKGADVYSPKTLRSTQGAIFKINIVQNQDIIPFFENKQVIGGVLDKNAIKYSDLKLQEDFILVLGNEGHGISKEVIDKLTNKVYIPINFESLNVASAGAILLNEYKK